VTEQDTKVAGYAHNAGKASILVINKWDLIEKETGTLENYERQVREKFPFMAYAPIVFISARTGQRVEQVVAGSRCGCRRSGWRASQPVR